MCALSRVEHKTLCRTSIIIDAANAGVRVPVCLRTFRAVVLVNRWRMDDDDDHDHRYTREMRMMTRRFVRFGPEETK